MATPSQEFAASVKKLRAATDKHNTYFNQYERLRSQRRTLLSKITDSDVKELPAIKHQVETVTAKMTEARNRSINQLKLVSEVCEKVESSEIVHGFKRENFKLV